MNWREYTETSAREVRKSIIEREVRKVTDHYGRGEYAVIVIAIRLGFDYPKFRVGSDFSVRLTPKEIYKRAVSFRKAELRRVDDSGHMYA